MQGKARESLSSIQKTERRQENDVTTNSLEAWKAFGERVDLAAQAACSREAIPYFQRASAGSQFASMPHVPVPRVRQYPASLSLRPNPEQGIRLERCIRQRERLGSLPGRYYESLKA